MLQDDRPLFTTRRLSVRRVGPQDLDAMFAVYGNVEAMRWVGDGEPLDRAGCAHWITVTQNNVATRGYGMCAMELRATGQVIGFCGLVHPGGQPEAEIKYALLQEAWGQGYASEAAQGLLEWGRRALGLREIIATTAPENAASHRVLQKAGLQRGELRSNEDGSLTQLFGWRSEQP